MLVIDKNLPRGRWLLGRCVKIFPGRDGQVRTAEIKTKESILIRPISKYNIELCLFIVIDKSVITSDVIFYLSYLMLNEPSSFRGSRMLWLIHQQ